MERYQPKTVRQPEPARRRPTKPAADQAPAAAIVPQPDQAGLGPDGGGIAGLPVLHRSAGPARVAAVLALQRTHGNAYVHRLLQPPAIHRQPRQDQPPPAGGAQTITDRNAAVRDGPPGFKSTGKNLAVGTRVEVIDTQVSATRTKRTYVNLIEHGTGKALGWTSRANLGDVQYANAAASFVYAAKVKPRAGHSDTLPVMVYLPPGFNGKTSDIVLYLHGDAADYAARTANNYTRENPAIGMGLTGGVTGANLIVIAPQVNEFRADGSGIHTKSPWHTLQAGDYESIVQTVLTNLTSDLKLSAPIPRGAFSIAGHSGGGKGLGQAVRDLDQTGGGVKDVTLVEAGYGGGENKKGKADGVFAKSFQMVRDWLLEGKPDKVLRVLTKAGGTGTDTRHAIENNPKAKGGESWRTPVLGLAGVKSAIKAKGRDADLQAEATEVETDPRKRTGGMRLIRKIVVSHKDGGKVQGTIHVFLMADPPRDKKVVDTHFGVRNATIDDLVSGRSKGDDFASQ
jgi:hypothetical protein